MTWNPSNPPGSWDYPPVDPTKLLKLSEVGEVFWFERLEGSSAYLRYAEGNLVEAVLPDPEENSLGINIMANVVLIRGVPRRALKISGWVRGRISGPTLDSLYEESRDAARPCASLTFRAEDMSALDYDLQSEEEKALFLQGAGFKHPPFGVIRNSNDLRFLLTAYPFESNSELVFRPNSGGESGSVHFLNRQSFLLK